MTTHAQATASPAEIHLGSLRLRLSPLTDRDISELDQWLQQRVIRTARASLAADASPEERRETIAIAIETAATLTWMSATGARLMSTIDGWAQIIWQGAHRDHPDMTPGEIRKHLMDPGALDEARETFERLNIPKGVKKKQHKKPKPKRPRGRR